MRETGVEEKLLLGIFSAEIWMNILERASASDIDKAKNTSTVFQKLIFPFRTKLLFLAICSLVLTYVPENDRTLNVLLDCRLVCRSWCKNVTRFVQDKMQDIAANEDMPLRFPKYLQPFCETFRNTGRKSRFLQHFKSSHLDQKRNPFVSRYIKVEYCNELLNMREEGMDCYHFNALEELLSLYGHHIWHCELVGTPGACQIHRILSLLPNLKTITANIHIRRGYLDLYIRDTPPGTIQPLPEYSDLQCLRLTLDDVHNLFDAVLTKNRNISRLERYCWYYVPSKSLYLEPVPNLTNLKIRYTSIEEFRKLKNMAHTWPLKVLHLDLCRLHITDREMVLFLRSLEEKFAGTIEILHISFPIAMNTLNPTSWTINLPKLKCFSVTMWSAFSLDLVLPMKHHLQFIDVNLQRTIPADMLENLSSLFSTEKISTDFNVWSTFLQLKKFTVTRYEILRTFMRPKSL